MIGLDKEISQMNELFEAALFTSSNRMFFGRAFRNKRNGKIVPEVYLNSSNEYRDVRHEDKYDVMCFYDVMDRADGDLSQHSQEVGVVFISNLKRLYPAISYRAVEEFKRDVLKIANKKASVFDYKGFIEGYEAYGDIDATNLIHKVNMHPWYIVRFNFDVKYLLTC